jgi:nitrate/nitrite transport system substrate-binding protein
MAGATGKAAAQVTTRSRMYGREGGLDGSFFRFGPEMTMTRRIGPSLKDFTRRDVLASSALTAALFVAALLLFPANHETEGKGPHVTAQTPSR